MSIEDQFHANLDNFSKRIKFNTPLQGTRPILEKNSIDPGKIIDFYENKIIEQADKIHKHVFNAQYKSQDLHSSVEMLQFIVLRTMQKEILELHTKKGVSAQHTLGGPEDGMIKWTFYDFAQKNFKAADMSSDLKEYYKTFNYLEELHNLGKLSEKEQKKIYQSGISDAIKKVEKIYNHKMSPLEKRGVKDYLDKSIKILKGYHDKLK
jgi:hypothetical protein